MNQAIKKGRGWPRKAEDSARKSQQGTNSPGPGKGSVPNIRVGHCLGPEGNGVSSGEGGEGGPGPRVGCDEEKPACTE